MSKEENQNMKQTDHDLLIELSVDLKHLTAQVNNFMYSMNNKADRAEMNELSAKVNKQGEKIATLEQSKRDERVSHDTVMRVGNFGLKGWQIVTGVILTLVALWQAFEYLNK